MRITLILFAALLLAPFARAQSADKPDLTALSITALSDDKAQSQSAITALRAAGPQGLRTLIDTYQAAITRHKASPTKPEAMWDRLSAALDQVAAQKDAWAAGLYWYTDLDQAQRAAKATGHPILSLRLLGTLDTEFSCANSRFFRTALYPDAAVSKYLRENYILHWKSHRPVPKLTIDFGDGRTIERTITGNSVHYILTPEGQVVDVLPGLYGPAAFLQAINDAHRLASAYNQPDFEKTLAAYHNSHLATLRNNWSNDLFAIGLPRAAANAQQPPRKATALAATKITGAKFAAEARAVVALIPDRAVLATNTDDAAWAKIAALHANYGKLDSGSRAVILSKTGNAVAANNLTMSKRIIEDPITKLVRNFERSVAEDTVRNQYLFHSQIHEWFIKNQIPARLDDLNEKVYAQLFLMPKSDPYLGLVPPDTYTALPADATVKK
jgi:hypothetical protein